MKKEKKKTIVIIILAVIVFGFLAQYIISLYGSNMYSTGYNKAIEDIAAQQTKTGNIYTIENDSVNTVNIKEICGVGSGTSVPQTKENTVSAEENGSSE